MSNEKRRLVLFAETTPDLRRKVERLAKAKRRKISEIVRFAIEQYIERELPLVEQSK